MAGLLGAFKANLEPRWLTILGNSGTGKTHVASAAWDYMQKRSDWSEQTFIHSRVYWPSLVASMRGGVGYEHVIEMYKWPVLFLDDICAERDTTGFAGEQLNTLLGCRMGKWTIITSNLLLNQIGETEPRLADRMIRKPNLLAEVKTTSYALRKIK